MKYPLISLIKSYIIKIVSFRIYTLKRSTFFNVYTIYVILKVKNVKNNNYLV